ncbi:GUN4 domain-containing protein [Tolypothrix bouteillei VB521301_2]|uniref:GUN4 domain-containing protein n=1 Tax=Tolypothrix bouteillei TaxID=1246981 RepID=UPI0005135BE6
MSYCLNPNCPDPTKNRSDIKFCVSCGSKLLLAERYRAIKQIGQGGFGKTFLAVDEYKPSQPRCVIKQLFPQAQGTNTLNKASELFKLEAERLDELGHNHSQIPELLAYFTQDNQQYLVQEFIDGHNLAEEVTQNGTYKEQQIVALLQNLLPVLQFVHDKQVIHRDIKPENIIRRRDGELVLVDFGATKTATPTALAVTGTVIGTQGYTAPEQALGKATFASDIYSLGVTCLYLLTRIQPFELFDVEEGEWVWKNYLSAPVSNNLSQVLDKMISGAVKRRYRSAPEVLQALNPPQIAPTIINPHQPIPSDDLSSERNVDYTKLRDFLKAGQWKQADGETRSVMLKVTGREERGWLDDESMKNFPCTDLRTIDQLWVKYSSGRFGFSVQKQIYFEVGGIPDGEYNYEAWEKFGDSVGWRVKKSRRIDWIDEGTYDTTAPKGHLPVAWHLRASNRFRAGVGVPEFFSRIETCKV